MPPRGNWRRPAFRTAADQRSTDAIAALPGVLLLDTIGELSGLFALADVVFMGGTLAQRGGHNILEPALFAKPVITARTWKTSRRIADQFRAAGASVRIGDGVELAGAVDTTADDPDEAREIGRRALACAEAAPRRDRRAPWTEIRALHRSHMPRYRPAMPWYAPAWLLSPHLAGGRGGASRRPACAASGSSTPR